MTFVEDEDKVLWPSWSPVNDLISYTLNKSGSEIGERIYAIKADGTDMMEILSPGDARKHDGEPEWSPDGKILYFISNRSSQTEIWKVDHYKILHNFTGVDEDKYDDIGLEQISNLHNSGVDLDHRISVSPDGNEIVFYGVGPDWNDIGTNLYTINIDGTDLTNIIKSTDGDEWPDW